MKSTPPKETPSEDDEKEVKLLQVKVPKSMLQAVDEAVTRQDTDRSKFLRTAIRKQLALLA